MTQVAQWLVLSPHNNKIVGLIQGLGPLCVEFACSPCVWLGSSDTPKTCTKFFLCECLFVVLYGPAMNWWWLAFALWQAGIGSRRVQEEAAIKDGWIIYFPTWGFMQPPVAPLPGLPVCVKAARWHTALLLRYLTGTPAGKVSAHCASSHCLNMKMLLGSSAWKPTTGFRDFDASERNFSH